MKATIQQYLNALKDPAEAPSLTALFSALGDRLSSQTLTTGGLAIKAGASPIVKAATAFYAMANGVMVTKAANTDMAALSGTVANATFNVWGFYIDQAGTLTAVQGSPGATLAQVRFADTPAGKALIGFVLVNPTGTGSFVGGTTALDDATVVPNAVYVNTLGAFDPSVRLG